MQYHYPTRTVAVLRALQLGDLLCAVPAWRALRKSLPQAHITLIGLPWARTFVDRFPSYFDDFLEFPGFPGLPERTPDVPRISEFIAEAQGRRFDLVLQMHGDGTITNPIAFNLAGKLTAGFYRAQTPCPDHGSFYPYPDDQHEVHRHLRLMAHLGIPVDGDAMEFPLYQSDYSALAALQSTARLQPQQYICLHAGGRAPERRWPVMAFAQVANTLNQKGFTIVLTGSQEESALAESLAGALRVPPVNVVGRTDLGSLGALLNQARMLVSNDTGVSHLAAALRRPSVILCTRSDPRRWGPLDRHLHRVLLGETATVEDVTRTTADLLLDLESVAA